MICLLASGYRVNRTSAGSHHIAHCRSICWRNMAKYCKLLGSRFWQSTNQSIIYLITHIETFPSNPSIFCGNEFVMHGVLSRKDGFMFDRVQANCCNHALHDWYTEWEKTCTIQRLEIQWRLVENSISNGLTNEFPGFWIFLKNFHGLKSVRTFLQW